MLRQADSIREYVARNYVDPARRRGQRTVKVRAGEVVEGMGLAGRCPNVCSALDARVFGDRYPVRLVNRSGPRQSPTATWEFEVLDDSAQVRRKPAEETTGRSYTVLLRPEPEGGYTVLVPALQGCVTFGETIGEALARAEEAVLCHALGLRDLGLPVPVEGPVLEVPVEELTGTLLAYRVSAQREAAQVA